MWLNEDLQGDDARIYWLSVINDEIAGSLEQAIMLNRLDQQEFERILRKTYALANTAFLAGGNKINHLEH